MKYGIFEILLMQFFSEFICIASRYSKHFFFHISDFALFVTETENARKARSSKTNVTARNNNSASRFD